MSINKVELIEEINDSEELAQIIAQIITAMGVIELNRSPNSIQAMINNDFGSQTLLFMYTTDHLTKNYIGLADLKDSLQKKIKHKAYNAIFIVSSKNITEGFKIHLNRTFGNFSFTYWGREELIDKIDKTYSDYWRHNDQSLINYEKSFEEELKDDWTIKRVKQFKSAHEKLLDIFIAPGLFHKIHDVESQQKTHVKVNLDKLLEFKHPVIIQGEPGAGKTRILKEIGHQFISENSKTKNEKYLPIFINNINLIESRDNVLDLIDIQKAVQKKVSKAFPEKKIEELVEDYVIVFLIDSMDEFSKENQEKLLLDLKKFCNEKTRIFLATRFQDYTSINGVAALGKAEEIYIEKFSEQQIRGFIRLYFSNDQSKADNLLNSLKENSIIQRLPITPLNLSLISILFEENNFEIPATITDIYDNFNNLLLGRTLPDSRFAFFDINLRERILSVYALELLNKGERSYMTAEDFHKFFKDFFEPIKNTINVDLLPAALDFLINNTGILTLQDGKYVKFLHESYMEYYASREIFNNRRALEKDLIEKFLEINWQYTAIFYAGRSKVMPEFLKKIIERTTQCGNNTEYYRSVHGLGYLIQALYLTEDSIRKEAVHAGLKNTLEIYQWMKKMSSDERFFFKALNLPITVILNTFFFFDNFNSITIKGPLTLAFDELYPNLIFKDPNGNEAVDANVAFKLFTLAMTLSSPRIGEIENMKRLLYDTPLLNDPLFERLLDFGVSLAGNKELYEIKEDLKRPAKAVKSKSDIVQYNKYAEQLYLTAPIGRLRFSVYDRIYPDRKFLILTEGKTDAQIIEHAFTILTGNAPYWEINPIHQSQGGANELAKALSNIAVVIKDKKILGIFDNDEKGNQEFNGLASSKFQMFCNSLRIKKHTEEEIFAIKLPIPPSKEIYYNKSQRFNFFSIEHYFPEKFLKDNNMLLETPIPDLYEITSKGSSKADFSKKIRNVDSPEIFKEFIFLFKEIDRIFNVDEIEYNVT